MDSPPLPSSSRVHISSETTTRTAPPRNNPLLPTPTELVLLSIYPALLLFGTLFAVLSPDVSASTYDPLTQSHDQGSLAPSYFARKNNLFNVLFVKRGWGWITFSFFLFVFTHPALRTTAQKSRATVRWAVVTAWWVFVTQWFFGPAIIDRGFRFTGGKCQVKMAEIAEADVEDIGVKEVFTAAACKSAGGRWSGGHDISGHVFLLVLGSCFLLQEVGWVVGRWVRYVKEERSVVMPDGAVRRAIVEVDRAERYRQEQEGTARRSVLEALGHGGKVAIAVVGLCAWMLLMTAIYFHTWFEKSTMAASPDKMPLKPPLPTNLPSLVKTAFTNAVASKDVNFYPTQVTILNVNSIPFQLRFSPSLANKPKAPVPVVNISHSAPQAPKKEFFNPFAAPLPQMLITAVGSPPSHNLVLNKFAIVPEHFILSTVSFKQQTDLLEADDLAAAWACIDAYKQERKELYVFFNSGGHSGASQPHRHLQLLPVENMRDGLGEGEWDVLAKGFLDQDIRERLPFKVFAAGIEETKGDGEGLRRVYLELYNLACEAVLGKDAGVQTEGEARISYNLAMTMTTMVVVPRLAEGGVVRDENGQEVGKLALNGTVLAGTALVKSQAEWDALRGDPDQVREVLGRIGLPNRAKI
ncbi:FIT family protein scs3 [Triangularia verruculosa]|uniref:FIT family protein scs3 n=1 Tax=Triangularia verruculosa TaxID=2587418 RepID=A0AAN7AWX4_9PEZI|nr:FIT family protein scs3 [Triangularia verruculosa]